MEFEDVSERITWECRRIAAAFEVKEWSENTPYSPDFADFQGEVAGIVVDWDIERATARLIGFTVGVDTGDRITVILYSPDEWRFWDEWDGKSNPVFKQLLVKGLFRLGIEDEVMIAFLNEPLTAHEKLELRLSLPRDFWPKSWLDGGEDEWEKYLA